MFSVEILKKIWMEWFAISESLAGQYAPAISIFSFGLIILGMLLWCSGAAFQFFYFDHVECEDEQLPRVERARKKPYILGLLSVLLGLLILVVSTVILACC